MPRIRSYNLPTGRRISYETRLAARRRYEEWEQRFQQAQFQNALPQGYEQQLAVPGIVAGGCYQQEQDWYPHHEGPPGVDSDIPAFYRWLGNASEDEYWAMRSGKLCRSDGERRATNLLRRHLTEEQWESLDKRRYFLVRGTTRTALGRKREHLFQITSYGVFELKDGGRRNFCIVALEPGLPGADWMLMVLLLIKSDTRRFFATAKTRGWQTMGCNQLT